MPQIDQLADGGALRADDDIPIERSAGTRKAHGFPTDPPGVSDTGTDTYGGNFGRDVNDEEIVAGMVDSANTTTTPTLENTGGTPTGGKTITMIDGSALWAGALQNAVHVFQYDSATDTWLLINPHLTPTGADPNTVTGTAGTAGQPAEWNTDGDLVGSADIAKIATGTYTGDGTTSQSITGVGFQPKYVKIWVRETVDSTNLNIFETTDTIIDDNASGGSVLHAAGGTSHDLRINRIISLDSDGFTVDDGDSDGEPNTNGEVYNYMAIG